MYDDESNSIAIADIYGIQHVNVSEEVLANDTGNDLIERAKSRAELSYENLRGVQAKEFYMGGTLEEASDTLFLQKVAATRYDMTFH